MAHGIEVLSERVLARERRGSEGSPTGNGVHSGARVDQASQSILERSLVLRQRLTALTDDLYELWRDALVGRDFELVTNITAASQSVHRAIVALDDGRAVGPDRANGTTS